jgi:hypothetical protein
VSEAIYSDEARLPRPTRGAATALIVALIMALIMRVR